MKIEEKVDDIENKNEGKNSSDFSIKTKRNLFDILKDKVNTYINPEKYFQSVLEVNEFEGLKTLVENSNGKISWKELVKDGVVKIQGEKVEGIYWIHDLDLRGTRIETLRQFRRIGGSLNCEGLTTLKDIGKIKYIWASLNLRGTKVKTLGSLKEVGGGVYCEGLETLEDLGDLEEVGSYLGDNTLGIEDIIQDIGGSLMIWGTKIRTLGKLKKVGQDINCEYLETLEDLGDLEEVVGSLLIPGTNVKSLGKLKEVGSFLDCEYIETLEDLGDLEKVLGSFRCTGTKIQTFGKLRRVGKDLYCGINVEKLEDAGELEYVGGVFDLTGTSSSFQIKMIKKIKTRKITSKDTTFGGNGIVDSSISGDVVEGINKLLDQSIIPGYLIVVDWPLDIQIKVTDMLKNGQLKVMGKVGYGGKVKGLIKLLDHVEKIGGLYLQASHISIQVEALYKQLTNKIKTKCLKVGDGVLERVNLLYKKERLDLDGFQEIFGENIEDIEDIESKEYAIKILTREYEKVKKELRIKGEVMKRENEGKELTEEEKEILRNQVLKLMIELKKQKEKIEKFGIKLDYL